GVGCEGYRDRHDAGETGRRHLRPEGRGEVCNKLFHSQHLKRDFMKKAIQNFALSLVGVAMVVALWTAVSATVSKDLPSPVKTWQDSKLYVTSPWEKRGEMDQGILRMAFYSLIRVAKGFLMAIAFGAPLGFVLGSSPMLARMFDPVIQVLRPISPLAWLPLGLILFRQSEPAALFTIALCSMWPTVINTMHGVRAIPQDYLNV